jgi:uncharacterized Fe-S radical SAM superfamily protein PflX
MDECSSERWDYAMIVKGIIDEDFVNYKVPSMVIMMPICTFKCGDKCQNIDLINAPNIDISYLDLTKRFLKNSISRAVVFQGLEPMDSFEDVYNFCRVFRQKSDADIVIYTGYAKSELAPQLEKLCEFNNIIIKYGRYIPDKNKRYDELLGVYLASDNQWAEMV